MGDHALKVVDLTMTRTEAPEMITGSAFDQPPSGKIAVKVFQLDFMRVQDFSAMAAPMLNPNMQGGLVQLQTANAAIVTDTVTNLQRIELLLRDLDRPNAGTMPKFYPLTSAKASDLVAKIRTIITGPLQAQLGTATTFSADDRTNQIILVADPRLHPFFDELIAKLGGKSDPNTRNEVIYLKHAEAPKVATILTNLINGQTAAAQKTNAQSLRPGAVGTMPATPTAPGAAPAPTAAPSVASLPGVDTLLGSGSNEFSSLVTIIPDERSNAVVVSGTVDDLRLIAALIDKLDTILAQVRIEVVIVEVTLDDNSASGISALGLTVAGDKLVGFSGATPTLTVSSGTVTRGDATTSVSGPWDLAGTIAIGTTPRKNNTSILSVPSITTSHAKKATFVSSEQRPIITGSQTSVTGTGGTPVTSSTVTQQDIGITLTVTPLIGNDGSVQMAITQDVKDVVGSIKVDANEQPIISHRSTDSFITAHSGEILVLGGMQRKKESKSTNRLGPIPFLGDLFGSRTSQKGRTELIFFLRPTVLTNTVADNAPAMKRVDELPQKDVIRKEIDPNYVPPKQTLRDKIFPK
ncbi:MAG: type II secretory pathway, component PulD [Verrucomicrobia bacterium]|nr:type II secretory pathway, component PulD [Verrucomicrobiota bacterium]